MMNTKLNSKTIKQAFVSAMAISLIALPLLASAADSSSELFHNKQSLDNPTDQEILYAKLKNASRDMCGSSSLQLNGSVERIMANDECYEGTLAAAVERLNNPEIKELHKLDS